VVELRVEIFHCDALAAEGDDAAAAHRTDGGPRRRGAPFDPGIEPARIGGIDLHRPVKASCPPAAVSRPPIRIWVAPGARHSKESIAHPPALLSASPRRPLIEAPAM